MASNEYDHALLEIRTRLHGAGGRKAAVMVGAGLSRNARHRTQAGRRLPDWQALTRLIASQLYPEEQERNRVLDAAGATSSATRLAEEYQIAFGRSSLVTLIRQAIPDEQFMHSRLHRDLLELPWADVFTTNYDRLLEDASKTLWHQHYDIVQSVGDLPRAGRPRIVKLHGTLPDLEHMVLTEEDYRRYPKLYAPLVSTVQAALAENVLCLIGFSGEDPNFLAWTGWLRDEMRSATPNTYFFTARELKPFQRQLFQERHIIPIALDQLVEAGPFDHETALQALIATLAKPTDPKAPAWNQTRRYASSQYDDSIIREPFSLADGESLLETAIEWRAHRKNYKGWVVLHRHAAERLWNTTSSFYREATAKTFEALSVPEAVLVASELAWRTTSALHPLYDEFVFEVIEPLIARWQEWRPEASTTCLVGSKNGDVHLDIGDLDDGVALLLREKLRHAREIGDDKRFDDTLALLVTLLPPRADSIANDQSFISYQLILRALGRLRNEDALAALESWDITEADPIWCIRKGSLLLERGLLDSGIEHISRALERVRSVPVSSVIDYPRLSVEGIALNVLHRANWVREQTARMSKQVAAPVQPDSNGGETQDSGRLAHASSVLPRSTRIESKDSHRSLELVPQRTIFSRLERLRVVGCDPNDFEDWLDDQIASISPATSSVSGREGFAIGRVTRTIRMGGGDPALLAAYRVIRFLEDAAIPLKIPSAGVTTTIGARMFQRALNVVSSFVPHEAVGQFLRLNDAKVIDEVLDRRALVSLSDRQLQTLFDASLHPLSAGSEVAKDLSVAACALLSHVAVRLPPSQLTPVVDQLLELQTDPRIGSDWQISEAVNHSVHRVLKSLPRGAISTLLPRLLATPVHGSPTSQVRVVSQERWIDPLTVLQSFSWQGEPSPVGSEAVDDVLTRISDSDGVERVNLCIRTAYLLDAGLLSEEQKAMFRDALFAKTDTHGLPRDTGCFDSLILLLPPHQELNEAQAFAAKHLPEINGDTWRELSRTIRFTRFRSPSQRGIVWSPVDLQLIVDGADAWLDQIKRQHPTSVAEREFRRAFGDPDEAVTEQLSHCLNTLERLVIRSADAPETLKSRAASLIARTGMKGWPVVQALPSLAAIGAMESSDAAAAIYRALSDRQASVVRQACLAVRRWLRHANQGQLPPDEKLLQAFMTILTSRRHDELPLLIAHAIDIVEESNQATRDFILNAMETAGSAIWSETEYRQEGDDEFPIGYKLRIRSALAHFLARADRLKLAHPFLERSRLALQSELFMDVQAAAEI